LAIKPIARFFAAESALALSSDMVLIAFFASGGVRFVIADPTPGMKLCGANDITVVDPPSRLTFFTCKLIGFW
jgi:hypothetical protein